MLVEEGLLPHAVVGEVDIRHREGVTSPLQADLHEAAIRAALWLPQHHPVCVHQLAPHQHGHAG